MVSPIRFSIGKKLAMEISASSREEREEEVVGLLRGKIEDVVRETSRNVRFSS